MRCSTAGSASSRSRASTRTPSCSGITLDSTMAPRRTSPSTTIRRCMIFKKSPRYSRADVHDAARRRPARPGRADEARRGRQPQRPDAHRQPSGSGRGRAAPGATTSRSMASPPRWRCRSGWSRWSFSGWPRSRSAGCCCRASPIAATASRASSGWCWSATSPGSPRASAGDRSAGAGASCVSCCWSRPAPPSPGAGASRCWPIFGHRAAPASPSRSCSWSRWR